MGPLTLQLLMSKRKLLFPHTGRGMGAGGGGVGLSCCGALRYVGAGAVACRVVTCLTHVLMAGGDGLTGRCCSGAASTAPPPHP